MKCDRYRRPRRSTHQPSRASSSANGASPAMSAVRQRSIRAATAGTPTSIGGGAPAGDGRTSTTDAAGFGSTGAVTGEGRSERASGSLETRSGESGGPVDRRDERAPRSLETRTGEFEGGPSRVTPQH